MARADGIKFLLAQQGKETYTRSKDMPRNRGFGAMIGE